MEIFDELVESEVSIVTPHVKALIEFCLQVCDLLNALLTVCQIHGTGQFLQEGEWKELMSAWVQ